MRIVIFEGFRKTRRHGYAFWMRDPCGTPITFFGSCFFADWAWFNLHLDSVSRGKVLDVGYVCKTYGKLLRRDLSRALGSISASMLQRGRLCLFIDTVFEADGTRVLRLAGHNTIIGRLGEPDRLLQLKAVWKVWRTPWLSD